MINAMSIVNKFVTERNQHLIEFRMTLLLSTWLTLIMLYSVRFTPLKKINKTEKKTKKNKKKDFFTISSCVN